MTHELILIDDKTALKSVSRRTRGEMQFLPAALEIVETPPSPTARLTTYVLLSAVVVSIGWSVFAKIDVVAVAEGRVIPQALVKQVQPLETGVVRGIYVAEGDAVLEGQLLIDIDPTEQTANLEQAHYDRLQAALDAESARVQQTRMLDEPFKAPDGAKGPLPEAVERQSRDILAKHLADVASLESQATEQKAARAALEAQIEHSKAVRPVLEERYEALRTLNEQGLAQAPTWQKVRQDLLDSDAEVDGLEHKLTQTDAQIGTLKAKRDEAIAAFKADASDRRLKALQKVFELDQTIAKETMREGKRHLVAPVEGTVLGLKTATVGGVVTPADTLMTIVPAGGTLEVDAMVANRDIGYVVEGQEVELKLETFSFTRYGTVPGRVRLISRDAQRQAGSEATSAGHASSRGAMAMNEGGVGASASSGELVFPARITLLRTTINVNGREMPVTPGMKVTVEIKTQERRVIGYLLDEVFSRMWTAGRER